MTVAFRLHDLKRVSRRRQLDAGERSERAWLLEQIRKAERRDRALERLASVRNDIAALDRLNRKRDLTWRETDRLVQLVGIERRELALIGGGDAAEPPLNVARDQGKEARNGR